MPIIARVWSMKNEQFTYFYFETMEDLEEYHSDTEDKIYATNTDKEGWVYYK